MLNDVNIDTSALTQGRWFKLGKTDLLIAHISNRYFRNAIASKTINGAISIRDACNALADGILLNWSGVKHLDGTDVIYTVEMAAYALMTNDELRGFVELISADIKNFEGI